MTDLYLRLDGHIEGPVSEAEIRQRLLTGALPRRAMSWRKGERRWISLDRRWLPRSMIEYATGLIAVAIIFTALAISILLPGRLFLRLPVAWQTEVFLNQVVGVTLPLAVGLTAIVLYLSYRNHRRTPLALALCGVLVLVCTPFSLALRKNQIDVLHAEDRIVNASVRFDEQKQEIHIDGEIGRQFSADVGSAVRSHPHAVLIVINSPGGLLHESFRASDEIVTSHIPLRVDGQCASACALLWASVPQREMTASSKIGFHQGRPLGDVASQFAGANNPLEVQSKKILKDAGFPEGVEQHREATPNSKMYWMDSAEVLASGIKARVVGPDGQSVNMTDAKWLTIVSQWPADNPMRRLYIAILQHEPSVENRYADYMYYALHNGNMTSARIQQSFMESLARSKAFASAPDDAVLNWVRGRQQDLAQAVDTGDEPMCQLMIGHTDVYGRPDGIRIDANERRRINERATDRLSALIEAIPKDALVTDTPIDSSRVLGDILDLKQQVASQLVRRGFPSDYNQWTKLQSCTYFSEYFRDALSMPFSKGATILRYSMIPLPRQAVKSKAR